MSTELRNVAVYGAGGNGIGHHLVKAFLSHPDHFRVSVIARASSKSTHDPAVKVIRLPESPTHADRVAAFQGLDAILEEPKIIDAAIEARVKRFLPSEYGINNSLPQNRQLNPLLGAKGDVLDYLKAKESTGLTWTAIPNGFWLDWGINLAPEFSDIDVKTHKAALWDNGTYRFSYSTLPWVAEAVAQVLRNPELTKNRILPVGAFEASQRDVVAALEKAQGVKYEISHVDGQKVLAENKKKLAEGDLSAIAPLIQVAIFLPGHGSNLLDDGVVEVGNDKLGLRMWILEEAIKDILASN